MRTVERNTLRGLKGGEIDIKKPLPEHFCLEDIARGLSQVCRWSGQVSPFYSVAAHSLNVYWLVRESGGTIEEQLAALLHDGSEAYLSDVPSPAKKQSAGYKRIEKAIQGAIYAKFGLKNEMPAIVKWADDELLELEAHALFEGDGDIWGAGIEEITYVAATLYNTIKSVYYELHFGEAK